MGMTMTEKILSRASGGGTVGPGDVAVVDVETAVLMDMTFLPEGWREILKVHDPDKIAIVFDHLVPAPTIQAATAMRTGRRFAEKFGIERLHDVGPDQGIAHAVVADRAYALPGTVLVNGDSHTCAAGAFNCAARGVGGPDMLWAVTTGKAWFRVGETVRYDFTGRLPDGRIGQGHLPDHRRTATARMSTRTSNMAARACRTLSINGRRTLATMGAELSAEFVIFEPDDALLDYVRARNPAAVRPGAARCRRGIRRRAAPSTWAAWSRWWRCPTRW